MTQIFAQLWRAAILALAGLSLAACDSVASLTGPTHQYVLATNDTTLPAEEDKRAELYAATQEVLSRRLEQTGLTLHRISTDRTGGIVLDVSGSNSKEIIASTIDVTGEMAFRMVDETATPQQLAEGIAPVGSQVLPSRTGPPMAVKRLGALRGRHIIEARAATDQRTDQPAVFIQFDSEGGRKLAQITSDSVNRPMAMVLDGEILSAPIIQEPILAGQLQLSGGFSQKEANEIAIALQGGALPMPLSIIEERELD
ncbi:MAG: hypothetical protein AAFQ27_02565 [Pseudomonadota bacterium]